MPRNNLRGIHPGAHIGSLVGCRGNLNVLREMIDKREKILVSSGFVR